MRIAGGGVQVHVDGWDLHLDRRYDLGLLRLLVRAARHADLVPDQISAAEIMVGEDVRVRHVAFEVHRPDGDDLVVVDLVTP